MKSAVILEYKSTGFNNGQVFIHLGHRAELVYYGPAAQEIYLCLKRFAADRKRGTGEWYEQGTTNGLLWMEKL